MRILKAPEERKSEILDAAEILFSTKGYSKTTIIDILDVVGIAKGTLYYYFKSKEEIMYAMVDRIIQEDVARAKEIVANETLSPSDKIFCILLDQKPTKGDKKDKLIEKSSQINNAEIHQRSIVQSVLHISPVLTEVVQEGINKGIFRTESPREIIEFLVSSGQTMFGTPLFQWTPEEMGRKVIAFISTMELLLGAEKGSFACMIEILTKNRK